MVTKTDKTRRNTIKYLLAAAAAVFCLSLCACGNKETTYTLAFSGEAREPGALYFLDYSINIWQDEASNPCGDCADQPVHLYVGATAEDAAAAVAELIDRMNDLWDVQSVDSGTIVLKERTSGSVEEFGNLASVGGLAVSGTIDRGGTKISLEAGNASDVQTAENTPIETDANRIAALYGPSYEMAAALGVTDRIVIRADVQTDSFDWAKVVFEKIEDTPFLDNVHTAVNFEEIMKYEPDLVLAFPRENEMNQFKKAGIATVEGISYRELGDTCTLLNAYADAIGGEAKERAQAYCSYFNTKISHVRERAADIPDNERKKVYYAGMSVLTTYGKFSDIPAVIEAAGGIAVTADLSAGARSSINYEQLMTWNPDYIFLDHGGINDGVSVEEMQEELYTENAYAALNAVQNKQVYTVPSGTFYWDMGLQKVLLVEYIAKTLYPDQFEDLDLTQEIRDFYERFFGYELSQEQAEAILTRAPAE